MNKNNFILINIFNFDKKIIIKKKINIFVIYFFISKKTYIIKNK